MRPHHRQWSHDQSRHRLVRWSASSNSSRSTPGDAGHAGPYGRDVTTGISAPNNRRASAKRRTHCSALSDWHEPLEPVQRTSLPFWRNCSYRHDYDAIRTSRGARLPHTALV